PLVLAFLEEIVEAAGADDVNHHAVHAGALADGHLGLRDGTHALHVDAAAAQEVQDADALVEARLADFDELLRRPLEPGGGHPAVFVPDAAKALPVARVAPQRPVVHRLD